MSYKSFPGPLIPKTAADANTAWLELLSALMSAPHGAPRGLATRELLQVTSVIDMRRPVVTQPARKLGYRFMAAEAAWILRGDNRVATIKPFSPRIVEFSDDGETFFGAYGPRIKAQLPYVVDKLTQDQSSRQAGIVIFRESPPETKDVPCTLTLQWMIRGRRLHCFANMRSSDIWLGWPYDVFNFTCVTACLWRMLREREEFNVSTPSVVLEPGNLYLTAASQHVYEHNMESARRVLAEPPDALPLVPPWLWRVGQDEVQYGASASMLRWLDRAKDSQTSHDAKLLLEKL
jgi:thymidylate synthase